MYNSWSKQNPKNSVTRHCCPTISNDRDIFSSDPPHLKSRYLLLWSTTSHFQTPNAIPWLWQNENCSHQNLSLALRRRLSGRHQGIHSVAMGGEGGWKGSHPFLSPPMMSFPICQKENLKNTENTEKLSLQDSRYIVRESENYNTKYIWTRLFHEV